MSSNSQKKIKLERDKYSDDFCQIITSFEIILEEKEEDFDSSCDSSIIPFYEQSTKQASLKEPYEYNLNQYHILFACGVCSKIYKRRCEVQRHQTNIHNRIPQRFRKNKLTKKKTSEFQYLQNQIQEKVEMISHLNKEIQLLKTNL